LKLAEKKVDKKIEVVREGRARLLSPIRWKIWSSERGQRGHRQRRRVATEDDAEPSRIRC